MMTTKYFKLWLFAAFVVSNCIHAKDCEKGRLLVHCDNALRFRHFKGDSLQAELTEPDWFRGIEYAFDIGSNEDKFLFECQDQGVVAGFVATMFLCDEETDPEKKQAIYTSEQTSTTPLLMDFYIDERDSTTTTPLQLPLTFTPLTSSTWSGFQFESRMDPDSYWVWDSQTGNTINFVFDMTTLPPTTSPTPSPTDSSPGGDEEQPKEEEEEEEEEDEEDEAGNNLVFIIAGAGGCGLLAFGCCCASLIRRRRKQSKVNAGKVMSENPKSDIYKYNPQGDGSSTLSSVSTMSELPPDVENPHTMVPLDGRPVTSMSTLEEESIPVADSVPPALPPRPRQKEEARVPQRLFRVLSRAMSARFHTVSRDFRNPAV